MKNAQNFIHYNLIHVHSQTVCANVTEFYSHVTFKLQNQMLHVIYRNLK